MFFISLMMIPPNCKSSSTSPPPFLEPHHEKINICQTCGDKGDLKRLIYCAHCQVSAEHSYCIGKLHKDDDGTISWKCEECSLHDAKCRSTPLRRSARISEAIEAKDNRVNIERENHEVLKNHKEAYLGESCKAKSSDENQDLPIKKRRRLDFKHETLEECEAHTSPSNSPSDQPKLESDNTVTIDVPYPESSNYRQAEPVSSPGWRGELRINKAIHMGVGAHVSSIASPKVHSTVSGLPPVVDVKMFSRSDVWPPSFQRSPPTHDSIGVYFFPQCESDEKVFDAVTNDVIERNLALKAIITHNVELLIFSSLVLFPTQDWRMSGKYYLWGVFRQHTGCKGRGKSFGN